MILSFSDTRRYKCFFSISSESCTCAQIREKLHFTLKNTCVCFWLRACCDKGFKNAIKSVLFCCRSSGTITQSLAFKTFKIQIFSALFHLKNIDDFVANFAKKIELEKF